MNHELIFQYFPGLTPKQQEQFAALGPLYETWNAQINVVSRKDIDQLYERHVLHSLGIAKVYTFDKGEEVMDLGTGGGFPGIPLAILFPSAKFHLVDSIGKKIKVVNEVAAALGLQNVTAEQARAEELKKVYDTVVTRAVAPLSDLLRWTRNNLDHGGKLLALKGGDLIEELTGFRNRVRVYGLADYFTGEFFDTKKWWPMRRGDHTIACFFLLVFLGPLRLFASGFQHVYDGVLGEKTRVVFHFEKMSAASMAGTLYYVASGKPIVFSGITAGTSCTFREGIPGGGTWSGKFDAQFKTFTGTWKSADGKRTYPFRMKERPPGAPLKWYSRTFFDSTIVPYPYDKHFLAERRCTYRYILLQEFPYPEIQQKINTTIFSLLLRSAIPPEVWNSADANKQINAELAAVRNRFKEECAYASDPDNRPKDKDDIKNKGYEFGQGMSMETTNEVSVVYTGHDLLSLDFADHAQWFHSAFHNYYKVISLQTGDTVGLSQVLLKGWQEPLLKLLIENFTGDTNNFAMPQEVTFNYYVTEDGLEFVFNPCELGPCPAGDAGASVAFESLQALIDPKGPLAWALKKQ